MKTVWISMAAMVVLAACGGAGGSGDRTVLVDNCAANGDSKETCTCIVDVMETNLEPDLFKKIADLTAEENFSNDDVLQALSSDEQAAFIEQIPGFMSCALQDLGQ